MVMAALLMEVIALAVVTVVVPGRGVATNIMPAIQGSRVAHMIASTAKDMSVPSKKCC